MARSEPNDHVQSYEGYDVGIAPVVKFVVLLTVVTLVVLGLMKLEHARLVRESRRADTTPHARVEPVEIPPEPRLQDAPVRDLARLREREDELLSSYGWVDRNAGVARVPIERAMDLVAKEGLPVRDAKGK